MRSLIVPCLIVLAFWGLLLLIVNPVGEFMTNDDWAYVKFLETIKNEGRLTSTSHGTSSAPGGPAVISHALWGLAFTHVAGYSLTTLRLSVLTMGVIGSLGLLVLLRLCGAAQMLALLGTLTLTFSPLFLSQCFTFMTDITFVTSTIFSFLFLHLGVERSRKALIAVGLVLALYATLTRQLGIAVPLAFVITCFFHSKCNELGRAKLIAMALGITLIPWLAFEFFLYLVGSTPITQNLRFHRILGAMISKGFPDYLFFMSYQILIISAYSCFFISPILALRYREYLHLTIFKRFAWCWTGLFVVIEAAIIAGIVDPPVFFYRNVIFDFGIGPILLKDTYILGIERASRIPKPVYYFFVYWTGLAVAVGAGFMVSTVRRLFKKGTGVGAQPGTFICSLAFLTALAYVGIILFVGFHDRYLMPLIAFLIVWQVSDMVSLGDDGLSSIGWLGLALIILVVPGIISVFAIRDFMEIKRNITKAHDYLVKELKVDPCNMDGGFEFNGYHCYAPRDDQKPANGLSWWWVRREDYLVTLGPLRGYRIIRTFPFHRFIGHGGAVFILQPK